MATLRRSSGHSQRRTSHHQQRSLTPRTAVNIDPYIVLGSAVVGFFVGMTGAGGGALMTPMLILLFGVKPSTAISSDLVAAVFMRPFGAAVHSKKTVNFRLVGWMVLGSVPMAFLGAYLLHLWGTPRRRRPHRRHWVLRFWSGQPPWSGASLDRRGGQQAGRSSHDLTVRPIPTVVIGMVGGLIVGMTSVGLRVVDDRDAAVPLPDAGSQPAGRDRPHPGGPPDRRRRLGALAFGHVEFAVTASMIIGQHPAVLVGSLISSSAPDRYVRPAITFVIFASGLKYMGLGTTRPRLGPVRNPARCRYRLAHIRETLGDLGQRLRGRRRSRLCRVTSHRRAAPWFETDGGYAAARRARSGSAPLFQASEEVGARGRI